MFASAWAIDAALALVGGDNSRRSRVQARFGTAEVVALAAGATLMFLLATAQIMARSRAGAGLTLLALFGIGALMQFDRRNVWRKSSLGLLAAGTVAVALFSAQFGVQRFLERDFSFNSESDTRVVVANNVFAIAEKFFPLGAGVGSFSEIYAMFEQQSQLLIRTFINRAHNDYVEAWLESGVVGGIALLIVFGWIARRSWQVWLQPDRRCAPIDILLARAATIAIGLLALHSVVDYPLRTSALLSVLAISMALLTRTVSEGQAQPEPEPERLTRLQTATLLPPRNPRGRASQAFLLEPGARAKTRNDAPAAGEFGSAAGKAGRWRSTDS